MSNKLVVTSSSERFTGRVKWFNNKAGYGFITVTDGCNSGSDIFVHHSTVKVVSEQYKYLVQGEYVEFSLALTDSKEHEYQASDVSGIKGGKLMCETRNDVRSSRFQYRSSKDEELETEVKPRSARPPHLKNMKVHPELDPPVEGEWSQISKTKKMTKSDNASRPLVKRGGKV